MLTPRHEAHVRDLVDSLTTYGFVHIKKDLLVKKWYRQDRLSKSIWRDIVDRFPEGVNASAYEVFEWGDDLFLLEKNCMNDLIDRTA